MSKKSTPIEEEKPEQKTLNTGWIFLGVAVVIGIILGLFWYANHETVIERNGFTFYEDNCGGVECWSVIVVTTVGDRQLEFYSNPNQVDDIVVQTSAVSRVLQMQSNGGRIIIAFRDGVPGEVGIAATNIARITGEKMYNIPTRGAVYGSQVTCEDADNSTTIIFVGEGDYTQVVEENGCIGVTAPTTDDILRVADAFGMHLIGILP